MSQKFVRDIEALLQHLSDRSLTLQDILEETSERGFSLIFFLLAFPFLFPMPPGLPSIVGPACLLLAGQMALGKRHPWLPKRLARFRFPQKLALQLLKNLKRAARFFGRISRSRLSIIANNPYVWRVNGLLIAWLTILLMLPIPGTNPFPTIGILLTSVAMLEGDGLLMSIAYLWTIFITGLIVFLGYALIETSIFLLQ
jgi:hypothetical protein